MSSWNEPVDATNSSCFQKTQRYFLCRSDLNLMNWDELLKEFQESYEISQRKQELLLAMTVRHPIVLRYPIKVSYQQVFLKRFMSQLETNNIEVFDDLYNIYVELLQKPDDSLSYYRHFKLPDDTIISICELKYYISNGTTGLSSWEGSFAMSEWILKNTDVFKGKTVLELGCGTGLVGLTVIKHCNPKGYLFSDFHPDVLKLLRSNINLNTQIGECESIEEGEGANFERKNDNSINALSVFHQTSFNNTNISVVSLNWELIEDYEPNDFIQPDVIIASEVVYDDSLFRPLCNTLEYFLRDRDNYAILACTVRDHVTLDVFLEMLSTRNVTITDVQMARTEYMPLGKLPVKFFKIKYKKPI